MLTKIIISLSGVFLLLSNVSYGQTLSIQIDSLVVSSLPFNLSPGMFPREPEEIRGKREFVIRDYTSISEFIKFVESDMNSTKKMDVYFNPYIVVDIYFGNTFFTISVDQGRLCRYENKKVILVNVKLYDWLFRRIYPNGESR